MSTHCYIGYVAPSQKIDVIYVHHDGYPQGVGLGLIKNYNTEEKVINLIVDGSRSSLNIDSKDNLFYDSKKVFNDLTELRKDVKKRNDIEYIYLWIETEQEWYLYCSNTNKMKSLESFLDYDSAKHEAIQKIMSSIGEIK